MVLPLETLVGVSGDAAPRSFYHDANPGEVQRAAALLQQLHERVTALSAQMPEQMQLQQLSARIARVLALDIASPIAK